MLLQHGHVLIAKQSDETCLIEFGPPTHAPRGIAADTVLAPGDPFERPDTDPAELVPLAVWPLADDTAEVLPTINDIALGHDGRVYVVSSHAKLIARLKRRLKPGEHARATATWRIGKGIPGGKKAHPEGLAILPSGRPLVGFDTKRAGDNLVVLQRLDSQ